MTFDSSYFELPFLLPLAIVLPVLTVWLLRRTQRQRLARLARLGEPAVAARLLPPSALAPQRWHVVRLATAAALVGIAASGPRWGAERSVVRSRGIDMVLALDASLSMLATDERPDRLTRLKQEVRRLRAQSGGDRIGVLAFAGRSYVLSPLTVDAGALDLFLENLDPSVVGQAGSSLARTIRQGVDLLSLTQSGADRALVVMSDGEAFEPQEDVVAEARRAREQGVSLVTVGFGTTAGSPIPIKDGNTITQKRDEQGQVVISRYSPDLLRAAAEAAGGHFVPAEATDKASRVRQALASLRTQARSVSAAETRTPRFQLFLAPALVLLLLDTLLGERRGTRRRIAAAARPVAALLLVSVTLAGCARSRDRVEGARAFHARQYPASIAAFRRAIDAGDRTPATMYNYGTALLAADSLGPAAEVLERAAQSVDSTIRYRALFNLGLAHLEQGLAQEGELARPALDAALAAYKRVLLTHPNDGDAKWNYELALRKKQEGGGGGGGGGQSQQQDPKESKGEEPQPQGGLGQQQAEQLLGSAAREERQVQQKQQKQNRVQPPPSGKDW